MAKQLSANTGDRLKLAFAIAALVIAGLFIASSFGAFDSLFRPKITDPMAGMTPQQQEEVKRQQKRDEEQAKITPPS